MLGKVAAVATCIAALATCLWFYIQLRQWQQHGDDYLFLVANVIVSAAVWTALIVAIVRIRSERRQLKAQLLDQTKQVAKVALITLFASWARDLAGALEEVWHHWDNNGKKLVHPLAVNTLPDVVEDWNHKELLEFRIQYRYHLAQVTNALPDYSDELTQLGFPSGIQYIDLKNMLNRHVESLQADAKQTG